MVQFLVPGEVVATRLKVQQGKVVVRLDRPTEALRKLQDGAPLRRQEKR